MSSNVVTVCDETLNISSFESNKFIYTNNVSLLLILLAHIILIMHGFIFHKIEHDLKNLLDNAFKEVPFYINVQERLMNYLKLA